MLCASYPSSNSEEVSYSIRSKQCQEVCSRQSAQHTLLAPGGTLTGEDLAGAPRLVPRALLLPMCLTPLQLIQLERKTRGASRAIRHDCPLVDCDLTPRLFFFPGYTRLHARHFRSFLGSSSTSLPVHTWRAASFPFPSMRAVSIQGHPCTSRCLCVRAGNFRVGRRACKCRIRVEHQLPSEGRVPALWSRAQWMEPLARSW